MKKVILNHESYLMYDEISKFKKDFNSLKYNNIEFILFPSIQYLSMFKDEKYLVGASNFFSSKQGSYAGEVNLESLKDMGINYTMIGQYQRIKIIGETKQMIKEKLFKSLNSKCNTLLCIGETKGSKKGFYSIKKEINMYLKSLDKSNLKYLSIIYEPKYIVSKLDIVKLENVYNKIKRYLKNKYNVNIDVYYNGFIDDENDIKLFNIFDGIVLNKNGTSINMIRNICDKLEKNNI